MEAAKPQKPRAFASVALDVPPPGVTPYRAGNRHHRASGCGVHIRRRPRAWRLHFTDPWRGCAAVIDAVRAIVSSAGSLPRKSLPHPVTPLNCCGDDAGNADIVRVISDVVERSPRVAARAALNHSTPVNVVVQCQKISRVRRLNNADYRMQHQTSLTRSRESDWRILSGYRTGRARQTDLRY
jgi:hypothetical protein